MGIDILYILVLIAATWKGFSKGFIVSVFSFFAILIGLAAAVKFSASVAQWLQQKSVVSGGWLPFISFLLVLVGAILLVRTAAALIQKSVELMFMGWANKLGGILLYILLYTLIFSLLLYFAHQMKLFSASFEASSFSFQYIEPLGPIVLKGFGYILPFFKNVFTQLESFFGSLNK